MALTVQDGVLVWQKVSKALLGANPASQAAFRDLKNYISQRTVLQAGLRTAF